MKPIAQGQSDPQSMATPAVLNPRLNRRSEGRGLVLLTACCGVFVSFASVVIYTFGVFLKPLTETFGWSRAQVSLAFTCTALTVAVCSPFIGRLLDRFPARRIVIPCTVVYGCTFASLAFLTPHIAHLLVAFVVLGVVGNGTAQLGYARVVSAWFDRSRGRALAAVMAGSGAGSMIFPPLAQALITAYGWRAAYAILGAGILAIAVPLASLFLFEPESERPAASVQAPRRKESLASALLSFPFVGVSAALLLFSFATNGLYAHWAPLLTDRGVGAEAAATVLSVAGFAALVSKLSTGYLLDRFRAGRAVAVLLACCAGGFAFVITGHTISIAFCAAILVGAGMGAESDAVPFLLTRYFGLSRFSELYGYTWCVYAVAGALGPLVMGQFFDRTGSYQTVLLVSLAMVVAAAALFASLPAYENPAD
jgi:predicted MFS family arabinose efflux permease